MSVPSTPGSDVVVYWRRGCPFCASLFRRLDRRGVRYRRVDIWSDPAAAATVRSITGGDETVPTVVVGPVRMVNPSLGAVLAAAAAHAPDAVPSSGSPGGGDRRRWFGRRSR